MDMYPTAVAGLILASSGPYFRTTVEDPDCILSPRNSAWSAKLSAAGLLDGEYEMGPTAWEIVAGVGWVFRRASGAALVVSPEEPSVEMQRIMSRGNESLPAGTGVWVVKTFAEAAT